ncbi:MAG: hypothetical protein JWQ22_3317 [Devosia sp.]|nr:hypothetical protein [Devosia sp.]
MFQVKLSAWNNLHGNPTPVNLLGLPMSKTLADFFLKLRDRSTLGQQVAVVTTALCLALIIALSTTAAFVGRQQAAQRAEAEIIGLASNMAERLDARMFERFREVRNLANLEPLRDIWADEPAQIRSVFATAAEQLTRVCLDRLRLA